MPRIPVTILFEPGDALLFYTDGASEARKQGRRVLPLADSAAGGGRQGTRPVAALHHPQHPAVCLFAIFSENIVTYDQIKRSFYFGTSRCSGCART